MDPRKEEADLLKERAPLINQMGIDGANESGLNDMVRQQLKFVDEQLKHYLPREPRGFGDDKQMPHEWGSMDTYDDMRNSIRGASLLLEELLDYTGDLKLMARRVCDEAGACATAQEIQELAGYEEEFDWDKGEWINEPKTTDS